jgi:hypothetical protein
MNIILEQAQQRVKVCNSVTALHSAYRAAGNNQEERPNMHPITVRGPLPNGDRDMIWFCVGHNDTHQFWLCVDWRGELWQASTELCRSTLGDELWFSETFISGVLFQGAQKKATPEIGYIGHH